MSCQRKTRAGRDNAVAKAGRDGPSGCFGRPQGPYGVLRISAAALTWREAASHRGSCRQAACPRGRCRAPCSRTLGRRRPGSDQFRRPSNRGASRAETGDGRCRDRRDRRCAKRTGSRDAHISGRAQPFSWCAHVSIGRHGAPTLGQSRSRKARRPAVSSSERGAVPSAAPSWKKRP